MELEDTHKSMGFLINQTGFVNKGRHKVPQGWFHRYKKNADMAEYVRINYLKK